MPKRDSAITIVPSTTPRRSPRSENLEVQKQSGKLFGPFSYNFEKKKLSKPSIGLENHGTVTCGLKRSSTLTNGLDRFCNLRQSLRISENRSSVAYGSKNSVVKGGEFNYEYSSCEHLSSRVIKSMKNDGVDMFQNRRSLRLSNRCEGINEHTEMTRIDDGCRLWSNSVSKEEELDPRKANVRGNSGENFLGKGKRSTKREDKESDGECRVVNEHRKKTNENGHRLLSNSVSKEEALDTGKGNVRVNLGRNLMGKGKSSTREEAEESDGECRGVNVGRKRKRDEEGEVNINGLNKDQELELQRAYSAANPTPYLWKKVPGKSAQECFDKVNAGHSTPPQRQRGAKKRGSLSPIHYLEVSSSKVLKLFDPNPKK